MNSGTSAADSARLVLVAMIFAVAMMLTVARSFYSHVGRVEETEPVATATSAA
jgi:hypothetical protein